MNYQNHLTHVLSNSIVDGLKTSKENIMEKLIEKLSKMIGVHDKNSCLTCGHSVRVNLFPVLQDILEENGLSAEKFASTSKKFEFSNNRLRAKGCRGECMTLMCIQESLEKM